MALITCRECGKEISDQADKCPNCGCPVNNESQKKKDMINNSKLSDEEKANLLNRIETYTLENLEKVVRNMELNKQYAGSKHSKTSNKLELNKMMIVSAVCLLWGIIFTCVVPDLVTNIVFLGYLCTILSVIFGIIATKQTEKTTKDISALITAVAGFILVCTTIGFAMVIYDFYNNVNNNESINNPSITEKATEVEVKEYIVNTEYDGLYSFEYQHISTNDKGIETYKSLRRGYISFNNGKANCNYMIMNLNDNKILEYTLFGEIEQKVADSKIYLNLVEENSAEKTKYVLESSENNLVFLATDTKTGSVCDDNNQLTLTKVDTQETLEQAYETMRNQAQSDIVKLSNEVKTQFKNKCTKYTYEQLARNPESVKGDAVKLTGEVVQVVTKPTQSSSAYALRVNITNKGYGFYTDTVYVLYSQKPGESNILEDDKITIYGIANGEYTYTTVLGSSQTVPEIAAVYIDIN